MNLQPSLSISYNDRRALFADELRFGGHGQRYLSGGGTFTPSTSSHVFYKIDFLSDTVVNSVVFRNVNDRGDVIYLADNSNFSNVFFVKNSTWTAPLTSITLSAGTAIAYQYKTFIPEDLLYVNCIDHESNGPDKGFVFVYSNLDYQIFTDTDAPLEVYDTFANS